MADFDGNPFADPEGINPFAVSDLIVLVPPYKLRGWGTVGVHNLLLLPTFPWCNRSIMPKIEWEEQNKLPLGLLQ